MGMSNEIRFMSVRELHDAHMRCADRVAEDDAWRPVRGNTCKCLIAQATGLFVSYGCCGSDWSVLVRMPSHYALVEQAFESGEINTHEQAAQLLRERYPDEFRETPIQVAERLTAEMVEAR